MTPTEKIKQLILSEILHVNLESPDDVNERWDLIWDDEDHVYPHDQLRESMDEFRCSGEPTGLYCDYAGRGSAYYESEAQARQMLDGSFVGWTHWYGGGKHSDPSSLPWLDEAYEVFVGEETRTVRVFSRAAPLAP